MGLKTNSQSARILWVLSDGRWHTSANIIRKSGAGRLNSRMSQLRGYGYVIDHENVSGKTESLRHKYRLKNPPSAAELETIVDVATPGGLVAPRDAKNRHRIYRMVFDELELVATATTPEDVGVALFTLGGEGEFRGSCVGWLDTHGKEDEPGTWILDPFDSTPL